MDIIYLFFQRLISSILFYRRDILINYRNTLISCTTYSVYIIYILFNDWFLQWSILKCQYLTYDRFRTKRRNLSKRTLWILLLRPPSLSRLPYSLRSSQREINIVFLMRGIIVRVELYEGCACGVLRSIWKVLNPFLMTTTDDINFFWTRRSRLIIFHIFRYLFGLKRIYPRLYKNSKVLVK